jgi:hypothetical protein
MTSNVASTNNQPNSTLNRYVKSGKGKKAEMMVTRLKSSEVTINPQPTLYKLMESSNINQSNLPFIISDKFYIFLDECNSSNIFSGSQYEKYIKLELVCKTKEIVYKIISEYVKINKLTSICKKYTCLDDNLCNLFGISFTRMHYTDNDIISEYISKLFIDDKSIINDKLSINEFQLPTDDITISFIGGVSTGKSTILNTIFCEQLTQCKI